MVGLEFEEIQILKFLVLLFDLFGLGIVRFFEWVYELYLLLYEALNGLYY